MATFFNYPTSPKLRNTRLVQDGWQVKAVATFLMIYLAHMDILFTIKVKLPVLIKWSYRSPNYADFSSLKWLSHFEMHVVQSLFKHMMPFWYPQITQIIGF